MKNAPHFGEGLSLIFGFHKGGWGVPPSRCSARNARRKSLVLPKLVGNALDRASPNSKRLGHLQDTDTLRKLLSHLPFYRAVDPRPAELHALSDGALETCLYPLANHRPLEFSKGTG